MPHNLEDAGVSWKVYEPPDAGRRAETAAVRPNLVLGTSDGALPGVSYRVRCRQQMPQQETGPARAVAAHCWPPTSCRRARNSQWSAVNRCRHMAPHSGTGKLPATRQITVGLNIGVANIP